MTGPSRYGRTENSKAVNTWVYLSSVGAEESREVRQQYAGTTSHAEETKAHTWGAGAKRGARCAGPGIYLYSSTNGMVSRPVGALCTPRGPLISPERDVALGYETRQHADEAGCKRMRAHEKMRHLSTAAQTARTCKVVQTLKWPLSVSFWSWVSCLVHMQGPGVKYFSNRQKCWR